VLAPATIDTYDHRMAMCFSLAALDGALRKGAAVHQRSVRQQDFP
jgi:3-phosphoshikimate 1-carboxyvinyltransferase